jgi:hypothetical protein
MRLLLAVLLSVLAAAVGRAQDRRAVVVLNDGTTVTGRVVVANLKGLQLSIGGEIVTIDAANVKTCRMEVIPKGAADAAGAPPAVTPPAVGAAEDPAAAPQLEGKRAAGATPGEPAPSGQEPGAQPAATEEHADGAPPPPGPTKRGDGRATQGERAAGPPRRMARLRERLELLDIAYPWLSPAAPTQWISLGLLLFATFSLAVNLSTRITGSEVTGFGASMVVAIWYMISGFLQVAMVPVSDVSTAAMLIGNGTVALLWLRGLFRLSFGASLVALAIQLGMAAIAFGILQVVDSLLKSMGTGIA